MKNIGLLNPTYSIIEIPNLTRTYTFLQITDTHLSSMYEDEVLPTEDDVQWVKSRNGGCLNDAVTKEEMLELLFEFSNHIKADMVFLTGDIIDTPTRRNFDNLYSLIKKLNSPILFSWGNHDWSFVSGYLSQKESDIRRPLFYPITKGNNSYCYEDFGEFIVFSIDNTLSDEHNVISEDAIIAFDNVCNLKKPVILLQHIPFYEGGKLTEESIRTWKSDITLGGNPEIGCGVCSYIHRVKYIYQKVAIDNTTPVVAVIAGHLHLTHSGILPNGVPQFVTNTGFSGHCRVFTVQSPKNK